MTLHLPTLLAVGVAIMFACKAAMMLIGRSSRVLRGNAYWIAGQTLALIGLALDLFTVDTVAPGWTGALLVLPWPILTLHGLRRFHARQPLRGKPALDGAVATLAVVAMAMEGRGGAAAPVFCIAFGICNAWTFGVMTSTGAVRDSAPTKALAVGHLLLALAALGLGGWALAAPGTVATPAAAMLVVPGGMLLAWVSQLLVHERVERGLRDSQRRLRFLANIDMLTQVPNRRHFIELAHRTLQGEGRGAAAVLMFDIDHFKHINDLLGHAAGDRALRVVSRCVQETLRARDVAGRYGGDEFALLLPRTSLNDAMAVAGRIVTLAQAMAEEQAIPQLSLSFGVVQMQPDEDLDEALRRADGALYEAKRQGRGRAVSALGDEEAPVFVESRRLGLTAH